MENTVQHLQIGQGLDISLVNSVFTDVFPKAIIHIQAQEANRIAVNDGDCALFVRITSARLQTMVGHGIDLDRLLGRTVTDGDFHIRVMNSALVRRIIGDLHRDTFSNAARNLYVQSKIIELLLEGISTSPDSDANRHVMAARDILLADPASPPSMAELSRLVGLSQRKLGNQFRSVFGKPALEWLADWRLERARDLVLGGSASISEIAHSLGYSHVQTFSTTFARRFGSPPTHLRRSASGKQREKIHHNSGAISVRIRAFPNEISSIAMTNPCLSAFHPHIPLVERLVVMDSAEPRHFSQNLFTTYSGYG